MACNNSELLYFIFLCIFLVLCITGKGILTCSSLFQNISMAPALKNRYQTGNFFLREREGERDRVREREREREFFIFQKFHIGFL